MTDADVDRLAALASAATPGPWSARGSAWIGCATGEPIFADRDTSEANRNYIVAANPAVVLAIVADLRGYRRRQTTTAAALVEIAAARDVLAARIRQLEADNARLQAEVEGWVESAVPPGGFG